jgi:hypothetical protein
MAKYLFISAPPEVLAVLLQAAPSLAKQRVVPLQARLPVPAAARVPAVLAPLELRELVPAPQPV